MRCVGGVRRQEAHTFLSLFHLDGEVQRSDGKVDCLWVHLPHRAEQVDDVGALITDQTHQQLRNPETHSEQYTYCSLENFR